LGKIRKIVWENQYKDEKLKGILPKYIQLRFVSVFVFCVLGVIILFLSIDMVENLDRFIDKKVPGGITALYYLYYIPYVVVLTLPVATLLATIFSIGTLAKNNEIVAMKALGYSIYQLLITLLVIGLVLSMFAFVLGEGVVTKTSQNKENIWRTYIENVSSKHTKHLKNLEIQEPPDRVITIEYYDGERFEAHRVKIETFRDHRLISRIDASLMWWENDLWKIEEGYQRLFEENEEKAFPILQPMFFHFSFTPNELLLAQIKPDEMDVVELYRFVRKIRLLGGDNQRWMTDFYLRITFPLANFFIILLSVPLVYNRRKKSLIIGFGISLAVCFFYFGLVKMGQVMGQSGQLPPLLGACLGNGIVGIGSMINLFKTRK
jgi:lipopolysaccharide export system permease protein